VTTKISNGDCPSLKSSTCFTYLSPILDHLEGTILDSGNSLYPFSDVCAPLDKLLAKGEELLGNYVYLLIV